MKAIFQGKKITIPNILSFSRICMIPFFVWMYLVKENVVGTVVILLLSGLTDSADGFIARRFNMISNLGKALDPLADKLTQVSMLTCLVVHFPHIWLILIVMVIKEIFLLITTLMAIRKTDKVHSADWHGKLTTNLLDVTMIVHLLFIKIPAALSDGLILLCTALIILSGVLYGIRNFRILHEREQ